MELLVMVLILCVHAPKVDGQSDVSSSSDVTNTNMVFLIQHGMVSEEGSWPWHAAIYRVVRKTTSYICGGSIIDRHTILTAAHCFFTGADSNKRVLRADELSVHVGRNHLSVSDENLQVMKVANIIIHPRFRMPNVSNDIAIVQLSSDIDITASVRPVSFGSFNDDLHQIVGKNGTVIGFGLEENDRITGPLREATITVVDFMDCLFYDRDAYASVLTRNMFCAVGKNNTSACNGDSGGGMFFNVDGTWHLRGIVSFMPGRKHIPLLCDSSKPTVFTDVSKYREWVLRYKNTAKWLKELKPCQDGVVAEDAVCNAATRHGNGSLFLAGGHGILRVSLSDGESLRLSDDSVQKLVVDCAEGRIFWDIFMSTNIYSANYDGTDMTTFLKLFREPYCLGVDWVSRRLYWSDKYGQYIKVVSLKNPNKHAILFTNTDANIIVVDPIHGKLYWTNQKSNIEMSNLDGSERQILIEVPQTGFIDDMKVFMATGELCYADGPRKKIQCIDTRSKRIRSIINSPNITFPLLSVGDEQLFWMQRGSNTIESIDHYSVRQKPIYYNMSRVYNLEAVTNVCPMFHSECAINNGGCQKDTICLLSPRDPSGKTCKQVSTYGYV